MIWAAQDWVWIVAGWHNEVLLGLSHMVLVIWGLAITVLGLKRILEDHSLGSRCSSHFDTSH